MNRIDRLVAIILYLQGRRLSRAEDIASHFETSLRTVYRDLAALGEAGVPVVSEAGVGYSLLKGYHLPPVTFTPEEAGALATGGVLVAEMTDPSLAPPMRSALLKIRAVLPRDQQERLERVERATMVSERGSGAASAGERAAHLLPIQDALARRRVLRLEYRSGATAEDTAREIEPIGLVRYLQRWHLIAWCRLRRDFRDFRLDRIRGLRATAETFELREGFRFEDYLRRTTARTEEITVRVKFQSGSAERARREWFLGVVREEVAADGVVLTLKGGALGWFVGWLLSFGPAVTVLAPDELRAALADAAEDAARHHRRSAGIVS